MIIDVHYHLIPSYPDDLLDDGIADPLRTARIMGQPVDSEVLKQKARENWPDPDGEKLICAMDESGVDFTLVCSVDNAFREGFTPEINRYINKKVAGIAQKHPDRVMALAGVDPRRPEAPEILKECFKRFRVKGLKYHPDYGYDPSGPESYRLLEIVEEYEGILLTHTSPLGSPARNKYADPMLLSDICVDFPKLKVIAAHMGYVNWRPWASLATHHENLYGDLAMWDAYAFGKYELFCRELRDLIDYVGVEKVMFGTDDPIFRIVRSTKDWIQIIRDLPDMAPTGIKFTEEEVNAILGANAASILGIN